MALLNNEILPLIRDPDDPETQNRLLQNITRFTQSQVEAHRNAITTTLMFEYSNIQKLDSGATLDGDLMDARTCRRPQGRSGKATRNSPDYPKVSETLGVSSFELASCSQSDARDAYQPNRSGNRRAHQR